MKRYIRASYDSSMPDWLKTDAGKMALNDLNQKYAMSRATFSKTPTEGSIPIYLLDEVYKDEKKWGEIYKVSAGQYVYVPEFAGWHSRYFSTESSYRSIEKVAKSRFEGHILDTVYMTAPLRSDIQKDRGYMDPRYARGFQGKISYAGQTAGYDSHYNSETKQYEKDKDPYYSVPTGRDKSGYQLPNPEDLYKRLYQRFPDRLKGRLNEAKAILDEYYDKLEKAKTDLFSRYDIRKGKSPKYYGEHHYYSPSYQLADAIQYYGWMYEGFDKCINADGSVNPTELAAFMKSNDWGSASSHTSHIDKCLETFYKNLN